MAFHWSSQVPLQYKRSVIKGELNRVYRIASSFDQEVRRIRLKFTKVGYPDRFINSQIKSFYEVIDGENTLIPKWLFEDDVKIPFFYKNESIMSTAIQNLQRYTNDKVIIVYTWKLPN